ncbi:uncharacterized protein LOC142159959 [Mixophyes fleayi]|uniref:uncharacterized protein LOC142159959 n=1 Tax=Mixophyes fleayi TaxID=3061075 RepID=UPI003F4DF336
MEEWEYLEGHKGLYKDVMMENHQPLTSLGGLSNRNTPERCSRPLYYRDSREENQNIPQDYQSENLIDIKVEEREGTEETYVRGDQQCKEEEIPTDISTADQLSSRNTLVGPAMLSPDGDITQDSPEKKPITPDNDPVPHSADISSDPSHYGESSNNADIVTHNTAPKGDKIFPCSECGRCFTKKGNLNVHLRIHRGERPFSCSECGKCFTHKPNLVDHKRIHTGEKPFSCSECRKCFPRKAELVTHQRIHTGNKPFLCSECGKCFARKSILIGHHRIHTGVKPYSCSECPKCFINKSFLVRHQRIHTGEKPFCCSDCGKCFTQKSGLLRHQLIHTH